MNKRERVRDDGRIRVRAPEHQCQSTSDRGPVPEEQRQNTSA